LTFKSTSNNSNMPFTWKACWC